MESESFMQEANAPIMPLATAVWLVDNTTLTFQQIADFCSLHMLEIQAIADGQAAIGIKGSNPIILGQLTQEELDRCSKDPSAKLTKSFTHNTVLKKTKHSSLFKRQDKINAVSWIISNYPAASDAEISKLISTTRSVVKSIRDRTHPIIDTIKPTSPLRLGICKQSDLDKLPRIA